MPSSLNVGPATRFNRIARKLTFLSGSTVTKNAGAKLILTPQANPATCTQGEVNVGTDGKLYVCSATNTWTVVGTQA